jgi:MerR family transcriptional regulator, light-induced transcriptional regulator
VIDTTGLQREYLAAIRAGDRRRAFAAVDEARRDGLDFIDLYLDILQPALREVGRLWQENKMTVAEEHLATAISQMVMARVYTEEVLRASEQRDRRIVAACADSERHDVGLRMVCDVLERDGWDVSYLGASVPVESLAQLVSERRPDAVLLSASIAPHLPQLRTMIERVRAAARGEAQPFVLVGGRPFLDDPDLARRLGADASAADARVALDRLREHFT